MFDFVTAPAATQREIDALHDLLADLDDGDWARPARCTGWTVADLAAHLVGAARGQAEGLRRALAGGSELALLDPPAGRTPADLRTAFLDAATDLLKAIGELTPERDPGIVPLPFGPVPTILALQIVPLEYGFHRSDLLDALGAPADLPPDITGALLGVLPGLLPALAAGSAVGDPGAVPPAPVSFRLSSPSLSLALAHDGKGWSLVEDAEGPCEIEGDDEAMAFFAMGRIAADDDRLAVSDRSAAGSFKEYFPGP